MSVCRPKKPLRNVSASDIRARERHVAIETLYVATLVQTAGLVIWTSGMARQRTSSETKTFPPTTSSYHFKAFNRVTSLANTTFTSFPALSPPSRALLLPYIMSGVAFERIHSHKYKAIRYMLRDADWAILQGSDRWATDQDRLERFAELAEARVTHKQARKSTSAAERSSSTTEYHNPTSLAYLWGAAAREIRNSAISCGESRNGKEITALTLGTTGSRLATASCLAVAGYEMDREVGSRATNISKFHKR